MTESQIRAFCLLYSMLRALLMANGFETSSPYMSSCQEAFDSIMERLVE